MIEKEYESWCVLLNREADGSCLDMELPCQWHREPWSSYAKHGEGKGNWYLLIGDIGPKESSAVHSMLYDLDVRKYTDEELLDLYKYRMRAAFDAIAEYAELHPHLGVDPEGIKQLKEKFDQVR